MDSNPWQQEPEPSFTAAKQPPPYPVDPTEPVAAPPQHLEGHGNVPLNTHEPTTHIQAQETSEKPPPSTADHPSIAEPIPTQLRPGHEALPHIPYQPGFEESSKDHTSASESTNAFTTPYPPPPPPPPPDVYEQSHEFPPPPTVHEQSNEFTPPNVHEQSNEFPPPNAHEQGHGFPLPPNVYQQSHEFPPPNSPPQYAASQTATQDITQPSYESSPAAAAAPQSLVPAQSKSLAPPPLPPRRPSYGGEEFESPIHYTRDPHRLIAYLVPFPKPHIKDVEPSKIEDRFLIYTPPPPPLTAPKEGEKEAKFHKVQRKWEQEVRQAKTSDAKVTSWKGIKGKATKGIDWAMGSIKSSNLDFLNRVPATSTPSKAEKHATTDVEGEHVEGETTKKTVGLEEMVLVYPADVPGTEAEIRAEFVNSMLRTKSKAQKDAVIATGLFPVALAIDILAGPFGGLAEIDGVWAFASIRGAKTARSVTKRLTSTGAPATGTAPAEDPTLAVAESEKHGLQPNPIDEKPTPTSTPTPKAKSSTPSLKLTFTPSPRLEVLRRYLASECHRIDARLFPGYVTRPVETDVIAAIGWSPSQAAGETRNWEDEQWEVTEVKEDFKQVMHKGAKEWGKWCKGFEKDPEKAIKK
ncbi:MAG: hypothetical protein Q9160_008710 [Pyrenula sp. 1 TL-2023]